MNQKIFSFGLAAALLLALSAVSFATIAPCSDGTPYGQCSTNTPGFKCWTTGLISTSGPDYANSPGLRCDCPSGWNYNSAEDMCKRTSCTDGGVTKNAGQCFESNKPKYCNAGTIVNKASVCGCPAGKEASGDDCISIAGYCNADADCGSPAKECKNHACVDKQDCRFGKPYCLPTSEECKLTDTGYKCVKKEGYQNTGQQGNSADNDYLNQIGENNTSSGDNSAASGLSCCCAPGAAMILVGAFAFSRRKE